jgi:ComF family protein
LQNPPAYTKVYCCGLYQHSLRQAIHKFKFSGGVALDRALGRMLTATVDCGWRPDLVVPVPLEQQRLRQRGYNQALLLARELARQLSSACDQQILRKTRTTAAQHELPAKVRRSNLAGVFAAGNALHDQKVLLVDDVMTTGATVAACSRTLVEAGAAEVRVAVVARSPL